MNDCCICDKSIENYKGVLFTQYYKKMCTRCYTQIMLDVLDVVKDDEVINGRPVFGESENEEEKEKFWATIQKLFDKKMVKE